MEIVLKETEASYDDEKTDGVNSLAGESSASSSEGTDVLAGDDATIPLGVEAGASVSTASGETKPHQDASVASSTSHSNSIQGRVDTIERLAAAVQIAESEGRTLRVQLHPPELGRMQIQVDSTANGLTARLQVETASAARLLAESLPQLKDQLQRLGATVDRIDIQHSEPAKGQSSSDQTTHDQSRNAQSDQGDASGFKNPQHQHSDSESHSAPEERPAEEPLTTTNPQSPSAVGSHRPLPMTSIDVRV